MDKKCGLSGCNITIEHYHSWEQPPTELDLWVKVPHSVALALTDQPAETCDGRIPTDGQLMDQLEAAFEKMNDGYVELDLQLRRTLADNLVRFNRPR